MATLRQHPRTDIWQVRFYWNGEQQERSCRTKNSSKALRILASVEETLGHLQTGRLCVPDGVPAAAWIVSGGKLTPELKKQPEKTTDTRFGTICDTYLQEQQEEGAKALTTLAAERTHIGHLKRLIGRTRSIETIDLKILKRYRSRRRDEKYRGNQITEAVRRELATFRLVWIWAQDNSYVSETCPLLAPNGRWRIDLPKKAEQIPFQTWQQIERRIKRGGLTEDQIAELWSSLFLDWLQVQELLLHVQQKAGYGFIYPMFAFAAYTGARRSEVVRSEIDDIDFEADRVMIRERKRRNDRSASYRHMPLHPDLKTILREWFQTRNHPGGQFTIAAPAAMPRRAPANGPRALTWSQATHHFKQPLKKSKWQVVCGFHVLRHSFGSNLVRSGKVTRDVVAEWMGHTSEEMKELYQHLFPQDGIDQISVLDCRG